MSSSEHGEAGKRDPRGLFLGSFSGQNGVRKGSILLGVFGTAPRVFVEKICNYKGIRKPDGR